MLEHCWINIDITEKQKINVLKKEKFYCKMKTTSDWDKDSFSGERGKSPGIRDSQKDYGPQFCNCKHLRIYLCGYLPELWRKLCSGQCQPSNKPWQSPCRKWRKNNKLSTAKQGNRFINKKTYQSSSLCRNKNIKFRFPAKNISVNIKDVQKQMAQDVNR